MANPRVRRLKRKLIRERAAAKLAAKEKVVTPATAPVVEELPLPLPEPTRVVEEPSTPGPVATPAPAPVVEDVVKAPKRAKVAKKTTKATKKPTKKNNKTVKTDD